MLVKRIIVNISIFQYLNIIAVSLVNVETFRPEQLEMDLHLSEVSYQTTHTYFLWVHQIYHGGHFITSNQIYLEGLLDIYLVRGGQEATL